MSDANHDRRMPLATTTSVTRSTPEQVSSPLPKPVHLNGVRPGVSLFQEITALGPVIFSSLAGGDSSTRGSGDGAES